VAQGKVIAFGVGSGLKPDGRLGGSGRNGNRKRAVVVEGAFRGFSIDDENVFEVFAGIASLVQEAELQEAGRAEHFEFVARIGRAGFRAAAERGDGQAVAGEQEVGRTILFNLGVFGEVPKGFPEKAVLKGDAFDAVAGLDEVVALAAGRRGMRVGGRLRIVAHMMDDTWGGRGFTNRGGREHWEE